MKGWVKWEIMATQINNTIKGYVGKKIKKEKNWSWTDIKSSF